MPGSETDRVLADMVAFARVEAESHDLEPWAELLRALALPEEERVCWLVKLYNAYDDLGSAWNVASRWEGPDEWARSDDLAGAADYPCTQERRNLRGGRVVQHLGSYADHLGGSDQAAWLRAGARGTHRDFCAYLRSVWGVGRQTAFEWAEFARKVLDIGPPAQDALLWESEGPRRSLQRIFGNPDPDEAWLEARAYETREHLVAEGVDLAWEDFETVICDFNVMRDGRYYPGRHLAALREEIDGVPELLDAWHSFVPAPWCDIAPGIDKALLPVYRDTGSLAPAFA